MGGEWQDDVPFKAQSLLRGAWELLDFLGYLLTTA